MKPLQRAWIPTLIVTLVLAARLIPGPRTIDDSYITFRYARNILAGNGFVYNPGERVMGTTTELYTLLMTGLGALLGGTKANFPQIALVVNALADCGTALILWQTGKHLRREKAGLAAGLVWAAAPFSVTFAIGGLETSLYVFLLSLCGWAYLTRRGALVALGGALSLLTRPDALILLGPLGLDWLVRGLRRRQELPRWREVLIFAVPVLAWLVFATLYFGSPIPHSVQAKLGAYRLPPESALVRLVQHYTTPFMEHNLFGTGWITAGLVLYPFLTLLGGRRAWKTNPRMLPWLAYPWLYLAVFAAANPLIFRWYLTPPLPVYILIILCGLEGLLTDLLSRQRGGMKGWQAALVGLVLVAAPLGSSLSEWRIRPDHGLNRPAPEMAWYQLELLYRQAAEIIAPDLTGDSVLAAGDVGVLGFYTPGKILDTVGLNSPQALNYYPLDAKYYVINYAVAPDLIVDEQPDAVVILEVYGREGLLKDERFLNGYELVKKLDTDIYGSDGMLIYRKK